MDDDVLPELDTLSAYLDWMMVVVMLVIITIIISYWRNLPRKLLCTIKARHMDEEISVTHIPYRA